MFSSALWPRGLDGPGLAVTLNGQQREPETRRQTAAELLAVRVIL